MRAAGSFNQPSERSGTSSYGSGCRCPIGGGGSRPARRPPAPGHPLFAGKPGGKPPQPGDQGRELLAKLLFQRLALCHTKEISLIQKRPARFIPPVWKECGVKESVLRLCLVLIAHTPLHKAAKAHVHWRFSLRGGQQDGPLRRAASWGLSSRIGPPGRVSSSPPLMAPAPSAISGLRPVARIRWGVEDVERRGRAGDPRSGPRNDARNLILARRVPLPDAGSAALITPGGGTQRLAPGWLRTPSAAVDMAPVATPADHYLTLTPGTVE